MEVRSEKKAIVCVQRRKKKETLNALFPEVLLHFTNFAC